MRGKISLAIYGEAIYDEAIDGEAIDGETKYGDIIYNETTALYIISLAFVASVAYVSALFGEKQRRVSIWV
jgi:hypothetical protein